MPTNAVGSARQRKTTKRKVMSKEYTQQRVLRDQLQEIETLDMPYDYVPDTVCGRLEIVITEGIRAIQAKVSVIPDNNEIRS